MKKTRTHREIYNKTREVITNKSILTSFFTSTLKFSLALALFFIIALLVYAGDVIVQNGKLDVDGKLFVDDDGNVGIGTTSPVAQLHVKSTTGNNAWIFVDSFDTNDATSNAGIEFKEADNFRHRIYNDGDVSHMLKFEGVTSGLIMSLDGGGGDVTIENELIVKGTGDTTIAGNVGIGTTNPDTKLHISTNSELTDYTSDDFGSLNIKLKNSAGVNDQKVYAGLSFQTGADDVARIVSRMNKHSAYASTYGDLRFLTKNTGGSLTDRLIITNDGNVGIGTTAPDHDLEIGTGTYSEIDAGEAQFTTGSSRTYKENINSIGVKGILNKISEIPVNTFDFKEEYCNSNDNSDAKCKNKIGLIAEDFHQIFERGDEKKLNGQEIQMALWLAVQELKSEKDAEIEQLKQRIQALEAK